MGHFKSHGYAYSKLSFLYCVVYINKHTSLTISSSPPPSPSYVCFSCRCAPTNSHGVHTCRQCFLAPKMHQDLSNGTSAMLRMWTSMFSRAKLKTSVELASMGKLQRPCQTAKQNARKIMHGLRRGQVRQEQQLRKDNWRLLSGLAVRAMQGQSSR